jgi:predicted GNAT superfamily acetyltransferase
MNLDLLVTLNNAHARETSWLDHRRLSHMVEQSCYARGIAPAKGFLLAFHQHAVYDSPNFLWWQNRQQTFVYIDRILVSLDSRRQGIARILYEDLFQWAASEGYSTIGCEVNEEPPNPLSDAFHEAMGFLQIGTGEPQPGKRVRYLLKQL